MPAQLLGGCLLTIHMQAFAYVAVPLHGVTSAHQKMHLCLTHFTVWVLLCNVSMQCAVNVLDFDSQ